MAITFTFRPTGDGQAEEEEGAPPPVTLALTRVRIGSTEECDLCLQHPSIAAHHATLEQRGGLFLLRDEGSEGGTVLEGFGRLAPNVERAVRTGKVVRFGAVRLELGFASKTEGATSRGTMDMAFCLVDRIFERGDVQGVILTVRDGPSRDKTRRLLDDESCIIGRGRDANMQIEDLDVSRHHARVTLRDRIVFVRDLGSSNGTYIGTQRLRANVESIWPAASTLRLGSTTLEHEGAIEAAIRELTGIDEFKAAEVAEGEGTSASDQGEDTPSQMVADESADKDAPAADDAITGSAPEEKCEAHVVEAPASELQPVVMPTATSLDKLERVIYWVAILLGTLFVGLCVLMLLWALELL